MKNYFNFLWMAGMLSIVLVSCSHDTETTNDTEVTSENLSSEQLVRDTDLGKVVSPFVDNNWGFNAVLRNSLNTAQETTFMRNQLANMITLWGGNSPLLAFVFDPVDLTFNAISYSNGRIYYGYDLFDFAQARGSENIGNVYILAHEYAHQLQFNNGIPSVRETTVRSLELEADGFAGYYLRRPNGFNKTTFADIATAYQIAFDIGDNATTNPGHHGTPAQRRSAVRLGFLLGEFDLDDVILFDSNFFFYYDGVLNGTFKLSPAAAGVSYEVAKKMEKHIGELRRIYKGEMSDEEYKNL